MRASRFWLALASAPLVLLISLTVFALVGKASTGALQVASQNPETWEAVGVSLRTSAFSLAAVVLFGTPLAYLLGRGRFLGRELLRAVVAMPAVLPPAAAGVGLLLALGRNGILGPALGAAGLSLPFTAAAVVIAQVFVSSPFHVLQAANAFADLDPSIEDVAVLEGAGSGVVFWHIVLPQVRASLASGATMAWARALGEFGATILFAGSLVGVTRTMPLEIYLGFESDLNISVALSCFLMGLALLSVLVGRLLLSNKTA